ncbi:hypothetical protein E5676_scaffold487G00420 [Cucumis melo var. makuwa]|uniref:Uncharacterized protein n=1 Tax=Cucumis melo var. makuwa TaxID=1194695 RepID=A0A5D3BHP8_CUCMM|nr:hypothetical protein E6C27_scaffold36G00480 [Cucumis melo var. makuwa]TYJ98015.1 hypothetical protein E5676_scaffold487G00420 [Cucumis melo var. makuwa]
MPNSKHVLAIDNGALKHFGKGYTQYNNVYKHYDVVGPAQHFHRLCRSGTHPALMTALLLRSTLNVNNRI